MAMVDRSAPPVLDIRGLNVYYGQSHALQGVDLTLTRGVISVVGRNGMGKTTLCKAIMGLVPVAAGSITFNGASLLGRSSSEIARAGIGYVPQGRRLWRSLTVDEHLKLVAKPGCAWTVERIYSVFPRLAERKGNGGAQLSGGEQQMLAISRALLLDPKLLVMDEPTEGLAPVIVDQVADMLIRLGQEGNIHVLVIEQNIGVATSVAENTAIMVNGRVSRIMDSQTLFADRDLQQRLLGVGRHGHDDHPEVSDDAGAAPASSEPAGPTRIYMSNPVVPTRWSKPASVQSIQGAARTVTSGASPRLDTPALHRVILSAQRVVLVTGTFDTKSDELRFLQDQLRAAGIRLRLIDLSTSGKPSGIEVPPQQVAFWHPRGSSGVFTGEKTAALAGMALAFERYVRAQEGVSGIIGTAGAAGSSLLAAGMRAAPYGIPKLLVSPLAAGDGRALVRTSDIVLVPALADIRGLTAVTRAALSQAAQAMTGMVKGMSAAPTGRQDDPRVPAIAITRSDATAVAVDRIDASVAGLDRLVFEADGTGSAVMEALVTEGRIDIVVDITLSDVADLLMAGRYPAQPERLQTIAAAGRAYIGACGGLDMVRIGPRATVPAAFRHRLLHDVGPHLTVMRLSIDEAAAIGRWLGERLNAMVGPVRFFLPEGGLSELGGAGRPFHDPRADAALFAAIEQSVRHTSSRQVARVPAHINDPAFAAAVSQALLSFSPQASRHAVGDRR